MADIIRRAFELAPACTSVDELKSMLKREGFEQVDAHLTGDRIRKELKPLFKRPD